jgi:hypothetical protein
MVHHTYGINWALAWDQSSELTVDLSRANNLRGLLHTSPSYRARCQTLHIQLKDVFVWRTKGKYRLHTPCIMTTSQGMACSILKQILTCDPLTL